MFPRHVVVAEGDEYLLSGNEIVAVIRPGLTSHQSQVGARLRFGEVHGAGPLAAHQPGQECLAQLLAGVQFQRVQRSLTQQRTQRQGQVGGLPHLLDGLRQYLRQSLSAVGLRRGDSAPAAFDKRLVGLAEALGDVDLPVANIGAGLVALGIEGREHVRGQLASFVHHRAREFHGGHLAPRKLRNRAHSGYGIQNKQHFIDRRPILGHGSFRKSGCAGQLLYPRRPNQSPRNTLRTSRFLCDSVFAPRVANSEASTGIEPVSASAKSAGFRRRTCRR